MATEHKNTQLQSLIHELKKAAAPAWKAVALELERPTRQRACVNLSSLSRGTKAGEIIIVPGKVLGDGEMNHSITLAALGFSSSASEKLKASKTSMLTIAEAIQKDPKGKSVRIFA